MSKTDMLRTQTSVLKVNIHCDGCKQKVKKKLHKIEGVYKVSIDVEKGKVTVTGSVDPATLIKKLTKAGKHAEIWGAQKNVNFLNNQFKNLQIDHGRDGKDGKFQKGGANQQMGGQEFHQQMHPHMKGTKDFKVPSKGQRSVEFNVPEDEDDDDYSDDFDDEEDFDGEFDDEFGGNHHPYAKTIPSMGGGGGGFRPQGPNKMMNLPGGGGGGYGSQGPNNMMNLSSGGKNGGYGKKGDWGKNSGFGEKGEGGKNGGYGGKGDGGKNGGHGKKSNGRKDGGHHKKGGWLGMLMTFKGKGGKREKYSKEGKGGKNGKEGNKNHGKSGGKSGGIPGIDGYGALNGKGGKNDSFSRKNNEKFGKNGGSDMDRGFMVNSMQQGLHEMNMNHKGASGGNMGPIGTMGNHPMGQMRNFPAVQGLPAGAGMNNGYFPGIGQANPYDQQQYMAQMMMNQQHGNGHDMYHPMMYGRPHPAMAFGPPMAQPTGGNFTHAFSDENTESCSIM